MKCRSKMVGKAEWWLFCATLVVRTTDGEGSYRRVSAVEVQEDVQLASAYFKEVTLVWTPGKC